MVTPCASTTPIRMGMIMQTAAKMASEIIKLFLGHAIEPKKKNDIPDKNDVAAVVISSKKSSLCLSPNPVGKSYHEWCANPYVIIFAYSYTIHPDTKSSGSPITQSISRGINFAVVEAGVMSVSILFDLEVISPNDFDAHDAHINHAITAYIMKSSSDGIEPISPAQMAMARIAP